MGEGKNHLQASNCLPMRLVKSTPAHMSSERAADIALTN